MTNRGNCNAVGDLGNGRTRGPKSWRCDVGACIAVHNDCDNAVHRNIGDLEEG